MRPVDTDTLTARSREKLLRRSEALLINSPLTSAGCAEELLKTRYETYCVNEDHVPSIAGTTMKVVELVVTQQAYGWSLEELHIQHPRLTLGQIHSALAYYWDHREELGCDIQRRLERVTEFRSAPFTISCATESPRTAVTPLRFYIDHDIP